MFPKQALIIFSVFHLVLTFKKFSGSYKAQFDTFNDYEDAEYSDKADFHFFMKKISRKDTVPAGKLVIKEEVGPLSLVASIEKLVHGGFKKFSMDDTKVDNICADEQKKKFMEYFNGTRLTERCTLMPTVTYLKPIPLDTILHDYFPVMLYGTFRITGFLMEGKSKIFGFQMVLIFSDASKGK